MSEPATVYTVAFDDPNPVDRDLLGGKGAGLVQMVRDGLNVPPGYVISTRACRRYLAEEALPPDLWDEVVARLRRLERRCGKTFGAGPLPLLLSIRSGAPVSMPGMMDTILNLGLGRAAAEALAHATGDTRFMADVLFRFHCMYAETVLGAVDVPERADLEEWLAGVLPDSAPGPVYDMVWGRCQDRLLEDVGETVPDDPYQQLAGAIEAVFRSWNTRRAVTYRQVHRIPDTLGTAVVVQSMVFGNLGADSGSGVVFTRNPATGEPGLFGEFLQAGQGVDVVAGIRTPDPIGRLKEQMPKVYREMAQTATALERSFGDVLDIEFTVERGILHLLQVRPAKRTAQAAVRIASDLLREGIMSPAQALGAVTVDQVRQVQRPRFDAATVRTARRQGRVIATGIGASPGQVSGTLVLSSERAEEVARGGGRVVLARPVTSPTDLHGMIAAEGILTVTGGSTSHAAVVARALGKTCIVGCAGIEIDPVARTLIAGDTVVGEGEPISLDGTTGEVFAGELTLTEPAATDARLETLLQLAAKAADCQVLARVSTVGQIERARMHGAAGVVTGVDDVLATSGCLAELVQALRRAPRGREIDTARLEEAIAELFTPLLTACAGMELGVRAIDFHADEAAELLHPARLFTEHPRLAMALGAPELVRAQLRGLARAAGAVGDGARVHLAVRNLSDPREARVLRNLCAQSSQAGTVRVGAYVSSPRGALNAGALAEHGDVLWLELRLIQAAMFGIPARHLLTQEPLEGYMRQGMLGTDPREAIDPAVEPLLAAVARDTAERAGCQVGIRLSGPVSQEVVSALYRHRFRRFAVDAEEVRPCTLALGKGVG